MKHKSINLRKLTRTQLELLVCCTSKKIYQKPLTCCYEADSIELKERRKEALRSEQGNMNVNSCNGGMIGKSKVSTRCLRKSESLSDKIARAWI
jgi:hypothetical protein